MINLINKIFKIKSNNLQSSRPRPASNGMTFVELIVVIGIFAAMTGVILFNFGGFTSNVTLQNLANQIALQIKSAQTDAINGKAAYMFDGLFQYSNGVQVLDSNDNPKPSIPSYGVYFDITTPTKFTYFADLNNDGNYDNSLCAPGVYVECQSEIEIKTSDVVNRICATNSGSSDCSNVLTDLHVTFKRPFPDANFFSNNAILNATNVQIEIISAKGLQKHIVVWSTGQIEIKSGPAQ